jgi:hypothetical protein
MLIGYARVSKDDQETAAQVNALKAVGCERIFVRRPPADAGIVPSFTGSLITSAKATCLLSGS